VVEHTAAAPRVLSAGASTLEASDIAQLENRKTHPYLEFMVIRDTLYLVGVTGLSGTGARRDAYLMKRIDQAFLAQLTLAEDPVSGFTSAAATTSGRSPPPAVALRSRHPGVRVLRAVQRACRRRALQRGPRVGGNARRG